MGKGEEIVGFVSDFDQDGNPDTRLWYGGGVDLNISGKWYRKYKDNKGEYIKTESGKAYLIKGIKYGKYKLID